MSEVKTVGGERSIVPRRILPMVFVTVVINYMDRTNIAVAAPALRADLGLSTSQMGIVFSAFAWTYAALQIPGGIVADRFLVRLLYPVLLVFWSLATLLQAAANGLSTLVGARVAIGAFEAPSFPLNNRIVTEWVPTERRAGAIAFYTSGQFLGLAMLAPMLVAIQDLIGWRGLFVATGLAGIAWAAIWYIAYRDPPGAQRDPPAATKRARSAMEENAPLGIGWQDVLLRRNLIGIYVGQFCLGTLTIFFLTWFPTYLVDYRGVEFSRSGWMAAIPFLAAFVGVLVSGHVSDWLVRRGHSHGLARKAPVLLGMALSTTILAANFTNNNALVILWLSIAFFGNGLASIAWVFVSLLAPEGRVGVVGGIFNFCGAASAIVTPLAIGLLVDAHDFAPAFYYIGFFAALGTLSYLVVVRNVGAPVKAKAIA